VPLAVGRPDWWWPARRRGGGVGIAQSGVDDRAGGGARLALPVVPGLPAWLSARHRDRSHHPPGVRRPASPLESAKVHAVIRAAAEATPPA